ncbi:MAG: ATP synthase F1 subunit epsilon [Nitrososphaerales archaeon]
MATVRLDFVSQDHMVFSGEVNEILAPGIEGELGILPRHAPMITVLSPGEVQVKREGQEDLFFAVSGGWMEVLPTQVTILARTAERSDEIDVQRADAARARAEELLAQGVTREERAGLELQLRRSQIRLRVGRRQGGWRGQTGPGQDNTSRME